MKGITVATKKPETAGKTSKIRAECGENLKCDFKFLCVEAA